MEPESKSSSVEQETGNKEEAFTHLAQGKRHLLVKDYNEAVTSLGMACTLLSKLYGDFANECGEAYFNYGKALLELARSENGVLDIDEEHEESQDSDDAEAEEEGNDAENVENGKTDDENKDTETEKGENETNGAKSEDAESKEKNSEDDGEEEDVGNLHLAWEMLEMAKVVFKKQAEDNKQMNLKLAEVHLKLGEVGLESENYSQAIEDMNTCLQIQLKNLDKHDRCIAETHYQLGIAYTLSNEFDNAVEQYNHALKLLQARIEYLVEREKQGVTSDDKDENNPFYSVKEEIAEINAILPEIKEKISDVEDCKKETKKALIAGIDPKKNGSGESSTKDGQGTSSSSSTSSPFPFSTGSASDAKPVSDISHLVRKKRKLETDSSEEKSSKQQCPDVSKPE